MATVLVAPAAADAKPSPRQQALVKMNGYLAKKAWAKRAKLGKCKRRKHKVICHGAVRGPRRSCRVKLIVKHRGVKLRVRKCQRRGKAAPGARAFLSASLGEPGRELLDPFLVTYPREAQDTTSVDPRGVLTLYVDGLLECAENVSGERAASTCPVNYDRLGSYRVTTIYTSGSESAADSMVHTVEPLGTSVSAAVRYEALDPSQTTGSIDWLLGHLHVAATVEPVTSGPIGWGCSGTDGPNCLSPPTGPATPVALIGRQCNADMTTGRNAEPICLVRFEGSGTWLPVEHFPAGEYFVRVSQSPLAGGYARSDAPVPLVFAPSVAFPPCDVENTGPWCP